MSMKVRNKERNITSVLEPMVMQWSSLRTKNTKWCVPDNTAPTKSHVSPGMLFGPWSPSSGNVMRVPGFQPFFTLMVRILSRILDVCPSLFITCHTTHHLSHNTSSVTQHITCHTTHHLSHNTSSVTQHITCHTTHHLSHNTSPVTQHITCHTTHHLSHNTSPVTQHITCHTTHHYLAIYGVMCFTWAQLSVSLLSIALRRDPSTCHFRRVKTNMDGYKYGWTGKKNERAKKIDIVSYVLKVSVNCVICVFVAHFSFRSSGTFVYL